MSSTAVAVLGSGNIGTDLMVKIKRSRNLRMAMMVGIDARSDGLARARRLGVRTTDRGIDGLLADDAFDDVRLVFDATSAGAHQEHADRLAPHRVQLIDLTPAALGPFVVPSVNLGTHLDVPDLNLVTCGGQATIPVVAAVSSVTSVHYAEIVATIASRSAGVGTRRNIDEFTVTTADALRRIGGAARAKAIIILNPADPPMIMRDTVHLLVDAGSSRASIIEAVARQVALVADYVPGYRLKQAVQFQDLDDAAPSVTLAGAGAGAGAGATPLQQVSVFLEVEGAAHYLPSYAGNLDIMTAAAVRVAERLAQHKMAAAAA